MVAPLAVDVDGTLTDGDGAIDPRVLEPLRAWPAPVVVATGKAFPYPVALCHFGGLAINVVAENGGVVHVEGADEVTIVGNRTGAEAVAAAYRELGHDLGWGPVDLVNRWRETELAVARDQPLGPLEAVAADHGMVVVDTGYAYHVKAPDVDKATGLATAADHLGLEPSSFAAVGDSANDAELFGVVGQSYAVANADDDARAAADAVTEGAYADGFLEALSAIAGGG